MKISNNLNLNYRVRQIKKTVSPISFAGSYTPSPDRVTGMVDKMSIDVRKKLAGRIYNQMILTEGISGFCKLVVKKIWEVFKLEEKTIAYYDSLSKKESIVNNPRSHAKYKKAYDDVQNKSSVSYSAAYSVVYDSFLNLPDNFDSIDWVEKKEVLEQMQHILETSKSWKEIKKKVTSLVQRQED